MRRPTGLATRIIILGLVTYPEESGQACRPGTCANGRRSEELSPQAAAAASVTYFASEIADDLSAIAGGGRRLLSANISRCAPYTKLVVSFRIGGMMQTQLRTRIGFVGLGAMGAPLAGRLLYRNKVYGTNRTKSKATRANRRGPYLARHAARGRRCRGGRVQHGRR